MGAQTVRGKARGRNSKGIGREKGSGRSRTNGTQVDGVRDTRTRTMKGAGKGKGTKGVFKVRRTIMKTGAKSKGFGRGRVKGRGRGRKGRGKGKGSEITKEQLDRELEQYMGPDAVKIMLNRELDHYFEGVKGTIEKTAAGPPMVAAAE